MQSIKLHRERPTYAVIKTDVFTPTMLVIDWFILTSLTMEGHDTFRPFGFEIERKGTAGVRALDSGEPNMYK